MITFEGTPTKQYAKYRGYQIVILKIDDMHHLEAKKDGFEFEGMNESLISLKRMAKREIDKFEAYINK